MLQVSMLTSSVRHKTSVTDGVTNKHKRTTVYCGSAPQHNYHTRVWNIIMMTAFEFSTRNVAEQSRHIDIINTAKQYRLSKIY